MSGELHTPLLEPAQASKLLDEVIYERVVGYIDVEGLFQFEQELWFAFDEAGCASEEDVPMRVKEMVDRALTRFLDDPRRYIAFGDTAQIDDDDGDDCPLCEQERQARGKPA